MEYKYKVEQEFKIEVTLFIKARTQEEALAEFEKRVGKSDYKGEDITIQRV